ncbi:putative baseplate assembly protein [Streptomyces sp. NBC_01233]|uniref:putative baseplate assembly protein n=1 Tax=Streptomyces sp. NBC_01233 TaxID=2903787 RepID=UPI002E0E19B5|nr:putative baseplate assembly protein [Streptomyces sp. NBC_01233]
MSSSPRSPGCCVGTRSATPAAVWNRPGLPALDRRIGTHRQFLDSMLARLSAADRPELAPLTTREPDDPSIALLDGWAVIADVLTFYQERIANEGYLRTATEQDSLTRLGRLVGHRPRPALAAATHLAYTLDPGTSTTIPVGSQVKSAPLPGGLPQTFETSEDLTARAEWNELPVRRTTPPAFTPDRVRDLRQLELTGMHPSIRPGDRLLFRFSAPKDARVRTVWEVRPDPARGCTVVYFASPNGEQLYAETMARLSSGVRASVLQVPPSKIAVDIKTQVLEPLQETGMQPQIGRYLSQIADPLRRLGEHLAVARATGDAAVEAWLAPVVLRGRAVSAAAATVTGVPLLADPGMAVVTAGVPEDTPTLLGLAPALDALAGPGSRPPTGSRMRPPVVADLFAADSDALPRLLAAARPQLAGELYRALNTVSVAAPDSFVEVQWLRVRAAPAGTAFRERGRRGARLIDVDNMERNNGVAPELRQLTLDAVYDTIVARSWIVVERGGKDPLVRRVQEVRQPAALGRNLSVRSTQLLLETSLPPKYFTDDGRRQTTVWAAGEALPVAEAPLRDDVADGEIELDGAYEGLHPGQWLVVSGERTDVPFVTGVRGTELVMLGGVRQTHGRRPGERARTTLLLTARLAYRYRRDTVVVHGNVTPATAGETRTEVLGSGDASRARQTFPLRQGPLTCLPAATPEGAADTLAVRVADLRWQRADDLTELGPADTGYRLRTGADGAAAVEFGDGRHGSRLPTGTENVGARYRIGSGSAGNVPAGQVNQVVSTPPGVSAVTNPLPATGGTDPDGVDDTRSRVPLRLRALDRLVSLRDYEDFARAFAGIDKASAQHVTDGRRRIALVTVAAVDDAPLAPGSPLITALETALAEYGDPHLPVRVVVRERVLLLMAAGIRVQPDRTWESVAPAVRTALYDALGFARTEFAAPAHLSTAYRAAQSVPGVDHVDVDLFTGVPDDIGTAALTRLAGTLTAARPCVPARPAGNRATRHDTADRDTLTSVARQYGLTVRRLLRLNPGIDQSVFRAGLKDSFPQLVVRRGLRPAQLAVLDPATPETLVLRRIP